MNRLFFSKKYDVKKIVLRYILFLLPFIGYGIYKNGILLYQKDLISFLSVFKVIYLILISLGINVIIKIIFKDKMTWDIDIISTIIISLFMPYNINYLAYVIGYILGSIIVTILLKFININRISIIVLITLLVVYFVQGLNFLNPLEASKLYSFNTLDLLWGRTYGGIASTFIIYAFVFIMISSIFNNYKYIIPIFGLIFYFIVSYFLIGFSYRTFTNSFAIIGLILLTVDSRSLPFSRIASVFYGLLWGTLLAIITVYLPNPIWIFMCQIVVNILFVCVAKMSKKCYNMNDFLDKKTRGVYGLYK